MKTALYLFEQDFRIHDNPTLHDLQSYQHVVLATVVEPRWFKPNRYTMRPMGKLRWQFFQQAISDLSVTLNALGQHLCVMYGNWLSEVKKLIHHYQITDLFIADSAGYEERTRLSLLQKQLPDLHVVQHTHHSLFDSKQAHWLAEEIPAQFTPFRKKVEAELSVSAPVASVQSLPPAPESDLPYSLPASLLDQNDNQLTCKYQGGENTALSHLECYFSQLSPLTYKQTRNALSQWRSSTKLSVWLSSGCLSARTVWHTLRRFEQANGANDSTYWIGFELLWREFFHWLAKSYGAALFSSSGHSAHKPLLTHYSQRLAAWCQGSTPYPLVNAIMHELNQTGYISNRARQIAASCLINELGVDWRYGAAWFEQQLLDYDVASNWGNWQYIAGVGADPRGGRHFNLSKQQEQYDPQGSYIHHWYGERTAQKQTDFVDSADWPLANSLK